MANMGLTKMTKTVILVKTRRAAREVVTNVRNYIPVTLLTSTGSSGKARGCFSVLGWEGLPTQNDHFWTPKGPKNGHFGCRRGSKLTMLDLRPEVQKGRRTHKSPKRPWGSPKMTLWDPSGDPKWSFWTPKWSFWRVFTDPFGLGPYSVP
jgi:hypothetical protein